MNDAKQLMQKYGFKPNKFLGQNFLVDKNVLKKILATADLSKNDTVLEVGPGLGILTHELAKRAGRVIAVEKDKKMADILKKEFWEAKNVKIIQGDILKFPISPAPEQARYGAGNFSPYGRSPEGRQFPNKFQISNFKNKNYKVAANIPYYLTSHLIRRFLESANPPAQMILMIQKEVAERICSNPPKMSLLAVSVQFYADAKIIVYVSKNSFWPKPKVDSAIIRITPRSAFPLSQRGIKGNFGDETKIHPHPPRIKYGASSFPKEGVNAFFRVVKAGFSQPRKQLINNLSRGLKIERAEIAAILKKIGLAPEQRAETLSLVDWLKLTKFL